MRNALIPLPMYDRTADRHGRRRGLSLMEVLISMFVLAIGLLGVASLLPVGQLQIAKGETESNQRNVAEAAFGMIHASGWLNPSRWFNSSNQPFDAVDTNTGSRILFGVGSSSTTTNIIGTTGGVSGTPTFHDLTGCVLDFRRGTLAGYRRRVTSHDGLTFGIGTFPTSDGVSAPSSIEGSFVVFRNEPFAIDPLYTANQAVNRAFAGGGSAAATTPMPRVTVSQGPATSSGLNIVTPTMADHICLASDDRSFVKQDDLSTAGKDETDTVRQIFHRDSGGGPAKRQSAGAYSWAATFVPVLPDPGSDSFGRSSDQDYIVSVAVFKNRLYRSAAAVTDDSHEIAIDFRGGGYGGGFAVLTGSDENLEQVRVDQWILVWNTGDPTQAYHWYKVEAAVATGDAGELGVRLTGPDWDVNRYGAQAGAKILVGCVGVYERRMQIERLPEYPLP